MVDEYVLEYQYELMLYIQIDFLPMDANWTIISVRPLRAGRQVVTLRV